MALTLLHDCFMATLAMQFSIWLRFALDGVDIGFFDIREEAIVYGAVALCVFVMLGIHRGIWRYTSFDDLIQILKAVTLATLIFLPVVFVITRLENLPRAVPFVQWPLLIALLSASRLGVRLVLSGDLAASVMREDKDRIPIVLAGPSKKTEPFIRETQRLNAENFPYRIVGLIDKDPSQDGHDVRGKRILGHYATLPHTIDILNRMGRAPQKVVITDPDMEGQVVSELLEKCDSLGLALARVPRLTDLQTDDGASQLEVRPVDLRDLLGRPQQVLDRTAMQKLTTGKRVLITGAGGTIGSELTRQVAALQPAQLCMVDNSEFNLYQIDLEMAEVFPDLKRVSLFGDVREATKIDKIFAAHKPQIVFHAAALKHVPIVEDNPAEGILTNVGGTLRVADACLSYEVETMVLISTDKAVNPVSVMGASKRIAELYCQALGVAQSTTRLVTVRFGNVLGSTGSVVPLFKRQLERGGPLTVTHPDASRYFMTTREAVELVLQAATLDMPGSASTAAGGHIYVLDMGEPLRIEDLAERMIQLAGLKPHKDIEIEHIGLRKGEKLHETLFHALEESIPTDAQGILLARPRAIELDQLKPALRRLVSAAEARDLPEIYRTLRTLIPQFEGEHPDISPDQGPSDARVKDDTVRTLK